MVYKVYFRRFVALLLCCVLVWSSFFESAYATDPVTAASLAITGGQLAGAGLSGEAALSLAGPVGAVVGVTLGALGVNAYVSKAAQEAGKTRTRFVLDKLVIWGAQAGYSQEQLYSKIAQGISVAADGTIQLGKDVARMIEQFGNWLFDQDGEVVEPPSSSVPDDITVSSYPSDFRYVILNVPFTVQSSAAAPYLSLSLSDGVFIYHNLDSSNSNPFFNCYFILASSVANSTATFSYNSNTMIRSLTGSYTYDGKTVYYDYFRSVADLGMNHTSAGSFFDAPTKIGNQPSGSELYQTAWAMVYGSRTSGGTVTLPDEVFTGSPEIWTENKDVLNPAGDTPVTLNPDLLNPIIDSLTDGQQATMSIIDYLESLQDAWDHALDDVQTAIGTITDSLTGIQEQIAVPQQAVKNPTVTNPSVTPETTPALDPSAVDPGTVVTGLSFDLTQIFPFCIPFDIYAMLATLSATPEAPVYHVHYVGPYNIVIDFTVDLTPWNSVASVLRTVELLAFCIGLAYVTRSMFIRS